MVDCPMSTTSTNQSEEGIVNSSEQREDYTRGRPMSTMTEQSEEEIVNNSEQREDYTRD